MEGDIEKDPEKIKLLDHIYKFDSLYRGKYLILSNWVEDIIGGLISEHFIPKDKNKRDLLYSLILINVPFNSKIRIFLQILERSYAPLNNKHVSLKNDLERIRNLRNRFAHSVLDTSNEFLAKKQYDRINLEFHKDGEKKFYEKRQISMRKRRVFYFYLLSMYSLGIVRTVNTIKITLLNLCKTLECHSR